MAKNIIKSIVLTDAREIYPETPNDKVMGTIFLNAGLRLVLGVGLILIIRRALFSRDIWPVGIIFWVIVLVLLLINLGYFIYSFNQYLQDTMQKINEKRKAEKRKQSQEDSASEDDHNRPAKPKGKK